MATKEFSTLATAGRTVYFRFMDLSNSKIFDFDDDAWETNLAACTTPKLSATEKTDVGDADESIFVASYDMTNLNSTATEMRVLVQAVDDLGTDEIISTGSFSIISGSDAETLTLADTGELQTDWANGGRLDLLIDAIIAAVAEQTLIDTTVASVTTQLVFVLTAGSDVNDAYNNQIVVLRDATNSSYPCVRRCLDYVGSTKTMTIDAVPDFTLAGSDLVLVFPSLFATAAELADAVWDETLGDHQAAGSTGVALAGAANLTSGLTSITELTLDTDGNALGNVVDDGGTAISGAIVGVYGYADTDLEDRLYEGYTDGDGGFSIPIATGATYFVKAISSGYSFDTKTVTV